MALAHMEYYRAADPDYLKVMNDNYYSPPDFQDLSKPQDWQLNLSMTSVPADIE